MQGYLLVGVWLIATLLSGGVVWMIAYNPGSHPESGKQLAIVAIVPILWAVVMTGIIGIPKRDKEEEEEDPGW